MEPMDRFAALVRSVNKCCFVRQPAKHSAIPSVQHGHQELLSRKHLQILTMLFCRGYWNDMFVCATFPKFIIDTNECFSLLQATSRKLPSNSGPPPLGSNMLMVDVFKLQNLFFPRHQGSHHHTWDFYSSNPTYSDKLVAATAAVVTVNIKFMTFLSPPSTASKGKSTPLSLLDLSLTFARLRAASLPRLAAARRLISIAPTDTELSPTELRYLPLSELRYIHG